MVKGHHPVIERQHQMVEGRHPVMERQQQMMKGRQKITLEGSISQGLNGNNRRQR